jgi:uncharacterized zinc-type alcohol dehydrogenase-like protein
MEALYDIPVTTIDGEPASLAEYKGKVLLVVNVASKCGLTPQYAGLERVYEAHRDRGFEVLGFPCNDFAGQEPGTEGDIHLFCKATYGVHFPMFSKVSINIGERHPLYEALIEAKPAAETKPGGDLRAKLGEHGLLPKNDTDVLWNFEKFLISRDGQVIGRFAPDITVDDPALRSAIESALVASLAGSRLPDTAPRTHRGAPRGLAAPRLQQAPWQLAPALASVSRGLATHRAGRGGSNGEKGEISSLVRGLQKRGAMPSKALGYAARGKHSSLKPCSFERKDVGPGDVLIDILYCGVCHSDLHQVKDDWKNTVYPCMPGHEIVGRVTAVGKAVTRFGVGDIVGVGCMIDSCGACRGCQEGLEQYCEGPRGWTATYNGPQKPDGTNTFGGYSTHVVVRQEFVLRVPAKLDIKAAAPILCAGVTTYSPLRHWKVKAGQEIGIVGFGGLGHMATKIAKAMGARVTVFTTSPDKAEDAARFGAEKVIVSKDKAAMAEAEGKYSFLLSTIPEPHDVAPYLKALSRDGTLVIVGALTPLKGVDNSQVAFHRQSLGGSLIGGIAETQEVLDFCGQHGILPEVEMIDIKDINDTFDRMDKGEVRYRAVIDMASLKSSEEARELAR